MLMGRNVHKPTGDGVHHATLTSEEIAKTCSDALKRAERATQRLPKLSDLVTTTDTKKRKALFARVEGGHQVVEAEISAIEALRTSVSAKKRGLLSPTYSQLCELRSKTADLLQRADGLFHSGPSFPAAIPVMNKAQTAELLDVFHLHRDAYWSKMYRVPAIQRFVLEELEAVTASERFPSLVVHTGSSKKVNESKLRGVVRGVVAAVKTRLGKPGTPVSPKKRNEVAELLLSTPMAPEKLNEQLSVLKRDADRLADIEIGLKCRHRSISSQSARRDPAFAEWKEIAQGFGGGALTARAVIAEIEQAQTPYLRIRHYVTSANFPFVKKVLGQNQKFRPYRDDVYQEGALGFMRAVERFDRKSGFALLTYAGYWVRQMAQRGYERESQVIIVPSRMQLPLAKLRSEPESVVRNGLSGVSEKLELRPDEVETLVPFRNPVQSLNHSRPGKNITLGTSVPAGGEGPEAPVIAEHDRAVVARRVQGLLAQLPERHRLVLIRRFGLDGKEAQTLNELGAEWGLTKERVRQLQVEAFRRLRCGSLRQELEKLQSELS